MFWRWRLDPCKHCGSKNVGLMYLGSKNRLDGGPDTPPIIKCRDCGKLSDMPIEDNKEKYKGYKMDIWDKCPVCGSNNFAKEAMISNLNIISPVPLMHCYNCGYKEYVQKTISIDKLTEFMEAVIKISKNLENEEKSKDKAGDAKIKSCPFCGSENVCVARPQEWEVGDVCYMHCNSCYTSTQLEPDEKTAIEHWNRRPKE